jgi:hypothetical protein
MNTTAPHRTVQITFHKCGSQWVRDVLTSPEIEAHTGITPDGRTNNLIFQPWPDQAPGTFLGPLYNVTPAQWIAQRSPDDRAIVVLRDPRDRLVSWVYSMAYSHVPDTAVQLARDLIGPMDTRRRILLGIFEFRRIAHHFEQWSQFEDDRQTLVTHYEKIVEGQKTEFRRIVNFLGWDVPDAALESAIERRSFAKRSGRQRGEEDKFSHYRKGVPGDWRHYFDRAMGQRWEELSPGLLRKLGYEKTDTWFEELPETVEALRDGAADNQGDTSTAAVTAQLVKTREERDQFLADLIKLRDQSLKIAAERRTLVRSVRRLKKMVRMLRKTRPVRWMRRFEKWRRRRGNGSAA